MSAQREQRVVPGGARRRPRPPRGCVLAVALLVIGGCGGDGGGAKPAATAAAAPDVVRFCPSAGPGWHALRASLDGHAIQAATIGRGDAVVLLNESDNDPCAWMAEAADLAADGHRAVVFRYGSAEADGEPTSAREALAVATAAAGGGKAQLLGASLGGRLVFEAAASDPAHVAAIVSLSGERRVYDYPDIRARVARVTVPVLYVGSRRDPLTDGARQPRQLHAALASRDARFRLLPGSAHGVALLENSLARSDVSAFLDDHR